MPLIIDNKKIFILEDDSERIAWFKRKCVGASQLDIASTVDAAIQYLKENDYDIIFLDHDLEREHYSYCDENTSGTGYDVAKWIQQADVQRQALVVIHTLNPEGGNRMEKALKGWYPIRCPFTLLRAVSPD